MLLFFLLPTDVAYADNCSGLSDCYGTIAAAVAVVVAVAAVVAVIAFLPEILAAAGMAAEAGEGAALAGEVAELAEVVEVTGATTETASALEFGANDLVYGPSSRGALRELADRAGGQLLTDIPKPPDLSWVDFSVRTLDEAASAGRVVRFDLTNVADLPGTLAGTGPYANTVTAAELRHIQTAWGVFEDVVRFYLNGQEVAAPWLL